MGRPSVYVEMPIKDSRFAAPWRRLFVLALKERGWRTICIATWIGISRQRVYQIMANKPIETLSLRTLHIGKKWIEEVMQRAKEFEINPHSEIGE